MKECSHKDYATFIWIIFFSECNLILSQLVAEIPQEPQKLTNIIR